jgi:hypothetical protein
MLSQELTTSVVTRGRARRAVWGAVILTISLGVYVGTASHSIGQTGTSTADICATDQKSDTLQEFAKKCADAVGEPVPEFNCDEGTVVPETHLTGGSYPNGVCDAPNVLNGACDPGSQFQVLKETPDVAIVGHCRKKGNADHEYGDIAVIQYNKKNGAICFYQALANDPPHLNDPPQTFPLPAKVTAPSEGNGPGKFPWLDPVKTAGINCVRCHDNGPFIRSPYLAQLRNEPKNRLPGTNEASDAMHPWDHRFTWNQTLPLSLSATTSNRGRLTPCRLPAPAAGAWPVTGSVSVNPRGRTISDLEQRRTSRRSRPQRPRRKRTRIPPIRRSG